MLEKIVKGVQGRSHRVTLYGPEGSGKTTLASSAPGALTLDIERGAEYVGGDRIMPETFTDILDAMRWFASGDHGYKTLVVDTIDELERFGQTYVCDKHDMTLEGYGEYGRGLKILIPEMNRYWKLVDEISAKGFHVIHLAHAKLAKEKEADQTQEVDRWQFRCSQGFGFLFREKSDQVWFLKPEKVVTKTKGRAEATLTGRRILHTSPDGPAYTKRRFPLPDQLEIPAEGGWNAVQRHCDPYMYPVKPAELEAAFKELGDKESEARKFYASQNNKQEAARKIVDRAEALKDA